MRFDGIEYFHIDELLLDEGNYRFRKAEDQQACIEKIYKSNSTYFGNLLTSIAEDDLGELLLVYQKDGESIVLDGNRRTAVIKVLWNPNLAPTLHLKQKAENFASKTEFAFDKIQAQVSDDQTKIYQTVYERHASGNGSRRLSWSAIAAARFRYDRQIHDDNTNWHSTALIFALEAKNSEIADFIDSKQYSHETLTRIVRAAISKGIISKKIFNERNMRLNKTPQKLLKDALAKVKIFLGAIESKELSLSRRGDSYADKAKLDAYLIQFEPTEKPEVTEQDNNNSPEHASDNSGLDEPEKDSRDNTQTEAEAGNEGNTAQEGGNSSNSTTVRTPIPFKIRQSEQVIEILNKLGSDKLSRLYDSLCSISLKAHASLMCVGAWAFFEVLATLAGKDSGIGLNSFFNSKINLWYKDKGVKAELKQSLKYIDDEGNVNKHAGIVHSFDARHLVLYFQALEPLIIKTIEEAIQKSQSTSS